MADQQQLDLLRQGVETWNTWRKQHPEKVVDLRGANLKGANLGGANLGGAHLKGAHLSGALFDETALTNI